MRYATPSPSRTDVLLAILRWSPLAIVGLAACIYLLTAVTFAIAYWTARNSDGSPVLKPTFESNDSTLELSIAFHFSFTTQATVGYGDFRPVGKGRWMAAAQSSLGILQIGVFPALLVFRALKRPLSIRLASRLCLVKLDDEHWQLWLRWVNPGPSDLFEFRIFVLAAASTPHPPYDTEAFALKLAYSELFLMPPDHVFLVHSEPFKLGSDFRWRFQVNVVATISGTGDRRSMSRWYYDRDVYQGMYANINSRRLVGRSQTFARKLISRRLDRCRPVK